MSVASSRTVSHHSLILNFLMTALRRIACASFHSDAMNSASSLRHLKTFCLRDLHLLWCEILDCTDMPLLVGYSSRLKLRQILSFSWPFCLARQMLTVPFRWCFDPFANSTPGTIYLAKGFDWVGYKEVSNYKTGKWRFLGVPFHWLATRDLRWARISVVQRYVAQNDHKRAAGLTWAYESKT